MNRQCEILEKKVEGLLKQKLGEIARSLGFQEDDRAVLKKWREYLEGIGIYADEEHENIMIDDPRIQILDPFLASKEWLLVPEHIWDRILSIGLP